MSPSPHYHFAVIIAIIMAATYITTVSATPIVYSGESHISPLVLPRDASPGDLPDPGPIGIDDLRRGPGGPWFYGPYTYYCGIFNTGTPQQIRSGSYSLRVVNSTYTAPPKTCLRVYCYDTSAIYVCNDNAETLTIPGYDIGWMADRLSMLCCDSHHGMSAQIFHPTRHWNAIVAYGNCRHDPEEPPSSFGTSNGGVNGDCVANESRPNPGGSS